MEYKVEVIMSPRFHDCIQNPYFWCVLGRKEGETKWFNCGHGWSRTQNEAWEQACNYYDDITSV